MVFLILMYSCSILESPEDISNPLDPSNPDFEPPTVTFIQGPLDGTTVDTSFVKFVWEGNQSNMNYSYRLDDGEWSEWRSERVVLYRLLDEGLHDFIVKSRYFNGVEGDDPQRISFTIDDLKGPALSLYPRYAIGSGGSASVEVIVHDVTDVAMVKVVLNYDPVRLTASSVHVYESSSFLARNGGVVIPFYAIDNAIGVITIEAAVATGNPSSVSGSGGIALIDFVKNSFQYSELDFGLSCEFRDASNTPIQINDFGHGGVYVE